MVEFVEFEVEFVRFVFVWLVVALVEFDVEFSRLLLVVLMVVLVVVMLVELVT